MKHVSHLLITVAFLSETPAQDVKRDIPYAEPAQERQVLDVYSPHQVKNLLVVFWIHGGGWQTGDKSSVQTKPQFFMDKGFVFVSTNYRLLPSVDMGIIVRDIAKSVRWVHDHIAEHGGDPNQIRVPARRLHDEDSGGIHQGPDQPLSSCPPPTVAPHRCLPAKVGESAPSRA